MPRTDIDLSSDKYHVYKHTISSAHHDFVWVGVLACIDLTVMRMTVNACLTVPVEAMVPHIDWGVWAMLSLFLALSHWSMRCDGTCVRWIVDMQAPAWQQHNRLMSEMRL